MERLDAIYDALITVLPVPDVVHIIAYNALTDAEIYDVCAHGSGHHVRTLFLLAHSRTALQFKFHAWQGVFHRTPHAILADGQSRLDWLKWLRSNGMPLQHHWLRIMCMHIQHADTDALPVCKWMARDVVPSFRVVVMHRTRHHTITTAASMLIDTAVCATCWPVLRWLWDAYFNTGTHTTACFAVAIVNATVTHSRRAVFQWLSARIHIHHLWMDEPHRPHAVWSRSTARWQLHNWAIQHGVAIHDANSVAHHIHTCAYPVSATCLAATAAITSGDIDMLKHVMMCCEWENRQHARIVWENAGTTIMSMTRDTRTQLAMLRWLISHAPDAIQHDLCMCMLRGPRRQDTLTGALIEWFIQRTPPPETTRDHGP